MRGRSFGFNYFQFSVAGAFSMGQFSSPSHLSRRHCAMSGDILRLQNWSGGDATGISWVEVREAAKHPTVHRVALPPTKNCPPPKFIIAAVKRSCSFVVRGTR